MSMLRKPLSLTRAADLAVCRKCVDPEPEHPWQEGWRCGYCRRCYTRWMEHGFPADGPPAERVQHVGWRADGRVEDYAWLLDQGYDRVAAAQRLGVTIRSALRYESRLRKMGMIAEQPGPSTSPHQETA